MYDCEIELLQLLRLLFNEKYIDIDRLYKMSLKSKEDGINISCKVQEHLAFVKNYPVT